MTCKQSAAQQSSGAPRCRALGRLLHTDAYEAMADVAAEIADTTETLNSVELAARQALQDGLSLSR